MITSQHTIITEVPVTRILDLRHRVLREGLPIETAKFPGDIAPTTRHYAAFFVDAESRMPFGNPVGCVTYVQSPFDDKPAWQVRGMAIEPARQGRGIGKHLLDFSQMVIFGIGIHLFWCNARVPAISFYEKSGWRIAGDPFLIPDAGTHQKMTKRL